MSKEKQRQLDEINRPKNEELFNNLEKQYEEIAKVRTESEQIEEMARVYDVARLKARDTLGSMNEGEGMWYSKAFYNAGYRKQSEWISVDERLPEECGMPVLMVAVNQYSQTRVVKGFTDYQCPITFHTNEREYDGVWKAWEVTHWMPLPEAPKGGAE